MTSYTVMQFVDKLMVAQVGPLELTAQSNGSIWSFNAMSFAMGVVTVINTYVSQYLGAGQPERGPRYAWAGFWLSIFIWLGFLLPYAAALPRIFAVLPEHSPELQQMESGYAQILLGGSVILLLSRSINYYFFGMHWPKVVTVAAIIGNCVNVLGNYTLIYGSAGVTIQWGGEPLHLPGVPFAPALGVYGAAIGTVCGTAVELAIPAWIFFSRKLHERYNTRGQWRPDFKAIGEVLKIGWPASVQWGNEIICWSLFMTVLVGSFGEDHMTAGWIALGYMHLSFMPALGFSVAVTSLVGKYIGAGQPDVAQARTTLGLALAVGYMTVCGLLMFVFREPLAAFFVSYDVPPEKAERIISIARNLMICAAVFQTFDAFGIIYSGALRGAGDTVWPGIMTIVYSWLFIVLGGWLLVQFAPQLESIGPWIAASVYVILFGLTLWWRFSSGRWRSFKLLHTPAAEAAEVAPLAPTMPAASPDKAVEDFAEALGEAEAKAAQDQARSK